MRGPAGILATALALTPLLAHPGLHHDIDDLTERIATNPSNVELYLERAHPGPPVSREDFWLDALHRRYSGPSRCC